MSHFLSLHTSLHKCTPPPLSPVDHHTTHPNCVLIWKYTVLRKALFLSCSATHSISYTQSALTSLFNVSTNRSFISVPIIYLYHALFTRSSMSNLLSNTFPITINCVMWSLIITFYPELY